jgi:hypothetical protein
MTVTKIWGYIVAWWAKWTSRWRQPALEVPTLEEFGVSAIEPDVFVPSLPIELVFIEPIVQSEPQECSDLQRQMEMFIGLLAMGELRAHRHFHATGSCNIDVPSVDCRVSKPIDSRLSKSKNSRALR